jgi:hypothetical protein
MLFPQNKIGPTCLNTYTKRIVGLLMYFYHEYCRGYELCCPCSCRWGEIMSLNCGHQRTYCSSFRWYKSIKSYGGTVLIGKFLRTWRETCSSATLSICHTWTDLGESQSLCGESPASNHLSHGTAYELWKL